MRPILSIICLPAVIALAQSGTDFSGDWKLNAARSEIAKSSATPVEPFLKVEQSAASITVWANSGEGSRPTLYLFPLDGRTETRKTGGVSLSTQTKWEGAALLASTIASGSERNYTIMERWKRSANGSTLTIRRTIVDAHSEAESTLVYENPSASAAPLARPTLQQQIESTTTTRVAPPVQQSRTEDDFVVASGTRILLHLKNAVDTRHSAPGDRVYLETSIPIFVNQFLVIPQGSYVVGTITESARAGKVKGRSALNLRFDSITLPNGVTRDFRSRAASVDAAAELDREEGRMKGESNKGHDAKTVGGTAATGAAIGTLAGAAKSAPLTGLGIGAAAGAAAGLAGVLMSRGPDIVLRPGTSMEMVIDRDLRFNATELTRSAR